MNASMIERELTQHCNGAGLMTQRELKEFIRSDGKVSDGTIATYLHDVPFVRTGKGGTKRYFIKEVARRMNELTE